VSNPITPTASVGLLTAMICYQVLSSFSFAADAVLQSFLLDEELRFQGNVRPKFMQTFALDLKNTGRGFGFHFSF
jgi:hypothetical protein